jgi:hypothetical protein
MGISIRQAVNDLLSQARRLRRHAEETMQPDYRAKFLRLARQVEARATEIDAEAPDDD